MSYEYLSPCVRGNDAKDISEKLNAELANLARDGWEVVQLVPLTFEPRFREISSNPQIPMPPALDSFQTTTIQILLRRPVSEYKGLFQGCDLS